MKFLIVSFALAAVASAQYHVAPGSEQGAAILRQTAEVSHDGSYKWEYETANGIVASEAGALTAAGPNGEPANNVAGEYAYTAPNGEVIQVKYTAGPHGYVATGPHIHPIPEAILKSLAYNAAHPQQEGEYKPIAQKPYYPQPTPVPAYEPFQYTTPKPVYYGKPSVSVFPQPTLQPVIVPRPVAYTPQNYFAQPGRR